MSKDFVYPIYARGAILSDLVVCFSSLRKGKVVESGIDSYDVGTYLESWAEHTNTDCWTVIENYQVANSGLKYDAGKLRYSLVPYMAFKGLAEVLTFGAEKYAPNSWQTVPNAKERYLDALFRHIEAYRNGEKKDSESGLSHLAHAMTNCAFLLHFENDEKA